MALNNFGWGGEFRVVPFQINSHSPPLFFCLPTTPPTPWYYSLCLKPQKDLARQFGCLFAVPSHQGIVASSTLFQSFQLPRHLKISHLMASHFCYFFFDHKCIWDFSSCRTKIYLFSWPSNSHKYFLEDGSPRVGFMSTEAWLNYPGREALMEKREKVRTEERLSLRRASWF